MNEFEIEYVEEILSDQEVSQIQEDTEQFEFENCKNSYYGFWG
jgi:hypothetical protein